MERYKAYEDLLKRLQNTDSAAYERLDEEVNIVVHKLKYIPAESRPKVLVIDDIRTLSQDFSALTREAVSLAGGHWTDNLAAEQADKIIFTQSSSLLYTDLPILLQQEEFSISPAVLANEIYIIQKEDFGKETYTGFLEDLEILAEIIQPKYFIYGRNGEDWVKFDLS